MCAHRQLEKSPIRRLQPASKIIGLSPLSGLEWLEWLTADRLDDDLQAQFARDVAVLSKGGEEILKTGRLERRQDVFFEDSDESSKRVCANL